MKTIDLLGRIFFTSCRKNKKGFILLKIDNHLAGCDRKYSIEISYTYAFSRKKPDRKLVVSSHYFQMLSQFNHFHEKNHETSIFTKISKEKNKKKLKKIYHFLKVDPGCYITICGKKNWEIKFRCHFVCVYTYLLF